jgi:hypothetical protein
MQSLGGSILRVAILHSIRGTPKSAEHYAKHALDISRDLGSARLIARALTVRAEVRLHAGNIQGAQEDLDMSDNALGSASRLPRWSSDDPSDVLFGARRARALKQSMFVASEPTSTCATASPWKLIKAISRLSDRSTCSFKLLQTENLAKGELSPVDAVVFPPI